MEAYRKLEHASNRGSTKECWLEIENALADIQLLGSALQVSLAKNFVSSAQKDQAASLDELIPNLRQSLRSELQLEAVATPVVYLRYTEK